MKARWEMTGRSQPSSAINIMKLVDLAARSTGHIGTELSHRSGPPPTVRLLESSSSAQGATLSVVFVPLSLLLEHADMAKSTEGHLSICSAPSMVLLQSHAKQLLSDPLVSSALVSATRLSVPAMKSAGEKSTSGILSALLMRGNAVGTSAGDAPDTSWILVFVTTWQTSLDLLERSGKFTDAVGEVVCRASPKITRCVECSLDLIHPLRPTTSPTLIVDMPTQLGLASGSTAAAVQGEAASFFKQLVNHFLKELQDRATCLVSVTVFSDAYFPVRSALETAGAVPACTSEARNATTPATSRHSHALIAAGNTSTLGTKRPREQDHVSPRVTAAEEDDADDEATVDLDDVPLEAWVRAHQAAKDHETKYAASRIDRIVIGPLGRPAALFVSLPMEDAVLSGTKQHLRHLAVQWSAPVFASRGETIRLIFLIVDADETFERTLLSWTTCPHADNYQVMPIFVASIATAARDSTTAAQLQVGSAGVVVDATVTSLGTRFSINWDESVFVGTDPSVGRACKATRLRIFPTIAAATAALAADGTNSAATGSRSLSPSRRHQVEEVLKSKLGHFQTLMQHQRRPEIILYQDRSLRLGLVRPPRDLKHTLAGVSIRDQRLVHVTAPQRRQFDEYMRIIFGGASWQSSMMQYLRDGKLPSIPKTNDSKSAPPSALLVSFFTPVVLGYRVFQLLGWVCQKSLRVQVHIDLNPLFAPSAEHRALLGRPDGVHVDDLCEVFFPGKSRCWSCPCTPRLEVAHVVTPRDGRKLCRHVQYMIQYFFDIHVGDDEATITLQEPQQPQAQMAPCAATATGPMVMSKPPLVAGSPSLSTAASSGSKAAPRPASGGRLLAAISSGPAPSKDAPPAHPQRAAGPPSEAPSGQSDVIDLAKLVGLTRSSGQ